MKMMNLGVKKKRIGRRMHTYMSTEYHRVIQECEIAMKKNKTKIMKQRMKKQQAMDNFNHMRKRYDALMMEQKTLMKSFIL